MSEIIIRIQAKRYQGKSRSGLSHAFLTAGYGGRFFNIPDKAVIEWKTYQMQYGSATLEMIEVRFQDWAVKLGEFGANLSDALDVLSKEQTAQVIR